MRSFLVGVGGLFANSAFAVPVTWTFKDVYLENGTQITGSFVYDADAPLDWCPAFDICPVLTIHTGELGRETPLDFVHNQRHLNIVVDRIQDKLSGKEDVIFPAED